MADETKKRTTSFAKTIDDLTHDRSALDRARSLNADFNRSADDLQWQNERAGKRRGEQERQTDERAPKYAPRPELHLRPGGKIRRAVDRQAAKKKLSEAARRAIELNKDARERTSRQKSRTLTKDFEKTRRHSR